MKKILGILFCMSGTMLSVTRLYEQFHPEHYDLTIAVDKSCMTFSGTVTMIGHKVGTVEPVLVLHQQGVRLTSACITNLSSGEDVAVTTIVPHEQEEQVALHTVHALAAGKYRVTMHFAGTMSDYMVGMYASAFEYNQQKEHLIATQFESHYARKLFPCIDEPEAKATYAVTLVTEPGQTVVSNTPIREQKINGQGELVTSFETTPYMSTYLLAFVFGKMACHEGQTTDGITVRVYATPDKVAQVDFSLDVAIKCLDFFTEYFGIAYPLKKCDMVALPDFDMGAMENWGCITYREKALLIDPAHTSLATKQQVALTVAHELAHQWFGNLVTMRWWTDLWLNEGFATWISYLAIDHLFPEWRMWNEFIVMDQRTALKLDALKNTHPVEVAVQHPDEIRTIFDEISYYKGASIIRMLHGYLGDQAFRDGLRYYLRSHAYQNTDTHDLWADLEKSSGRPVVKFMSAWTKQEGYPVVFCDVHDHEIRISQKRFSFNQQERSLDAFQWPIALGVADMLGFPAFFDTASVAVRRDGEQTVVLNHNLGGFYRVVYQGKHIHALTDAIRHDTVSPLNRLGILSDAFEGAKAGYVSMVEVLELLEAYHNEADPAVWDVILAVIRGVKSIADEQTWERFKPLIHDLTRAQRARLGWEPKTGESHLDTLLRVRVLSAAAFTDEPVVVADIFERFNRAQNSEDIAPDLRRCVYTTVARLGDEKIFEKLERFLQMTHSSEEHANIALALTSCTREDLIKRALTLVTSPHVRLQDAFVWIASSFRNSAAHSITWQWMQEHWSWIHDNLRESGRFCYLPYFSAEIVTDEAFLAAYTPFFEAVMTPALERMYRQGKEVIEWQSAWKKRDAVVLGAWLQQRG